MGEDIRRFADARIMDSINRVVADLPPGKTKAVVLHGSQQGLMLSAVARLGPDWTVMVSTHAKPGAKLDLGVEAVVMWAR